MSDYQITENGFKATDKYKIKRLRTHYPALFPLDIPFEDNKTILSFLKGALKEVDFEGNVFITCKHNLIKPIMLYGFISLGKYVQYDFIGGSRLQDIYFEKDDEYVSLSRLNSKNLILYLGYKEIKNKMQSELVEHVIEDRYIKGKTTWIFYKGSVSSCRTSYSGTLQLVKDRGYSLIDINVPIEIGKNKTSTKVTQSNPISSLGLPDEGF